MAPWILGSPYMRWSVWGACVPAYVRACRCAVVSAATFALYPMMCDRSDLELSNAVFVGDTLGLAAFSIIGAQHGIRIGLPPLICCCETGPPSLRRRPPLPSTHASPASSSVHTCGGGGACALGGGVVIVFGGIIRDILCNRKIALGGEDPYASATLAGASVYVASRQVRETACPAPPLNVVPAPWSLGTL
eukprot:SAG25_NODE_2042_length_2004_cov_1.518110_3_plen_191_part_00